MHVRQSAVAGLLACAALGGLLTAPPAGALQMHDFTVAGVAIRAEPRAGAAPNGLGNPGEGFEPNRSAEHELYRCDERFDSTLWYHGRNATTGVVGWVPACHLIDPD